MLNTLAFVCENVDVITAFLAANRCGLPGIPTEFVELYAILFPFGYFLRAIETRSCSLSMIVPLARQLLVPLLNVAPLLRTSTGVMIFRDMHIRFLAHLTAKNLSDCLAAYSLTLYGRADIRAREIGYSTQDMIAGHPLPSYDRRCDLKAYTVRNSNSDETLAVLAQLIVNTIPMIDPGGSTPILSQLKEATSNEPWKPRKIQMSLKRTIRY
jgi:hypothetical protein